MTYSIPLKYGWIAIPLFWATTLVGESLGSDVPELNLWLALLLLFFLNPTSIQNTRRLWYGACLALLALIAYMISAHNCGAYIFAVACGISYFFAHTKTKANISFLIIAMASFANLCFITNTEINWVQYDFSSCYNYIEYIRENHLRFWQENPLLTRPSYSTYHPILHYFLAAVVTSGGEALRATPRAANEALQVILVGYMLWYYVISARILELFDLPRFIKLSLLSFICLFPTYNAISGMINNDCLLLPLQAGAVYYTLLYCINGKRKNLIHTALFMVTACLTKLSGILILPMIGVALLWRLFDQRNKEVLYEQITFAVLLLLGISVWPLYQYFHLGVGASFVPPQEHLSLASFTWWQRFSPVKAFIYEKMFYDDYGENLWETLTKTALFGQWNFMIRGEYIMPLISIMIICYKLINALMLWAISYLLIKSRDKKLLSVSLALLLGLIGGLIAFSLQHPYMCNQDFRYIAILPLSYALILGQFLPLLHKKLQYICSTLLITFGILAWFIWSWVSI